MKKPTHKKNTLLKNAQANAEGNFFKRVFFLATQKNFFPALPFLIKLFPQSHGFAANTNSCASNVISLEQSLCLLQTVVHNGNSRAAGNISLKEILKKGTSTVNRTVVHLSISCCYTNSSAFNAPFFITTLNPSVVPEAR